METGPEGCSRKSMAECRAPVIALRGERSRNYSESDCRCLRTHGDEIPTDQDLWSHLPQQLLLLILARLPLITFIRARSVCKSWNSLMHSPYFLKLRSDAATSKRLSSSSMGVGPLQYYKSSKVVEFYYHPESFGCKKHQKKYRITLSFLPSDSASLVAGDGGLLCFCQNNAKERTMLWWVCNPVTKKWKELPSNPNVSGVPIVHMRAEKNPFRYKVMVYWGETRTWREYNSVTQSWSIDRPMKGRSYPFFMLIARSIPQLQLRMDSSP